MQVYCSKMKDNLTFFEGQQLLLFIQVDKKALVRIKKHKFKLVFLIILFGSLCMFLNIISQFVLILSFNASNLYYKNKMVSIKN